MKIDNLTEQLKIDEGVIHHIYKDPLGFKTFGIGHLVRTWDIEWNLPEGHPIAKDRVQQVFHTDVLRAIEDCETLYEDSRFNSWPCEVQEVLVNMSFNLGLTKLTLFKRFKIALLAKDWQEAAKEGRDSRWYEQVTNRAERLMTRLENV